MSTASEKTVTEAVPKPMGLFRLLVDQARIDDNVLAHPLDGSGTESDPYVVTWIPNDAGNPFNWGKTFKWTICVTVAMECFVTAFSSSAFSGMLLESLFYYLTED